MKKTTAGLIAGAAGILLLAGGSTYALWSDSATVAGGTIATGNLDIAVGTASWNEISDPEAIVAVPAIGSYKMVPGDILQLTQPVTITTSGDKMLGKLTVSSAQVNDAALFTASQGVTASYKLYDGATLVTPTSGAGAFGPTAATVYNFPTGLNAKAYTVQVTLAFDQTTPAQIKTNLSAALRDLTFTLDQVRPETP